MKLVSSILAIALAGSAASVSDELDLDFEGKNSCNVGSYKTTSCQVCFYYAWWCCMIIYNTITHYSSAQTWCEGAIADKWATNHGCDLEQRQDITNHHKEWNWLSYVTQPPFPFGTKWPHPVSRERVLLANVHMGNAADPEMPKQMIDASRMMAKLRVQLAANWHAAARVVLLRMPLRVNSVPRMAHSFVWRLIDSMVRECKGCA